MPACVQKCSLRNETALDGKPADLRGQWEGKTVGVVMRWSNRLQRGRILRHFTPTKRVLKCLEAEARQDKRHASVYTKTTWLRDAELGGIRKKQDRMITEVGTFGGSFNWSTDSVC